MNSRLQCFQIVKTHASKSIFNVVVEGVYINSKTYLESRVPAAVPVTKLFLTSAYFLKKKLYRILENALYCTW